MHRAITLLILVCMFLPEGAYANDESEKLLEKLEKCGEFTSHRFTVGCYENVYQESDRYLNQEYKELVSYLNGLDNNKHKGRLIAAQKTWVKFRDFDCGFYSDDQENRLNKCLAMRTIQRLKELEYFNTPFAMGCNGCPW